MTPADARVHIAHLCEVEARALYDDAPVTRRHEVYAEVDRLRDLADELDAEADALGVDREQAWGWW